MRYFIPSSVVALALALVIGNANAELRPPEHDAQQFESNCTLDPQSLWERFAAYVEAAEALQPSAVIEFFSHRTVTDFLGYMVSSGNREELSRRARWVKAKLLYVVHGESAYFVRNEARQAESVDLVVALRRFDGQFRDGRIHYVCERGLWQQTGTTVSRPQLGAAVAPSAGPSIDFAWDQADFDSVWRHE